ncbi:hypothetical protein ACU686_09835 [Yinghuangia aomiensis]
MPARIDGLLVDMNGLFRHWHDSGARTAEHLAHLPEGTIARYAYDHPAYRLARVGVLTDQQWADDVADRLAQDFGPHVRDALGAWRTDRGEPDPQMVRLLADIRRHPCPSASCPTAPTPSAPTSSTTASRSTTSSPRRNSASTNPPRTPTAKPPTTWASPPTPSPTSTTNRPSSTPHAPLDSAPTCSPMPPSSLPPCANSAAWGPSKPVTRTGPQRLTAKDGGSSW